MTIKHDFAWGDTRGIRQIFKRHTTFEVNMPQDLSKFGYPPHEGSAVLIEEIRKLVLDLTGHEYKHILITNGATHALNAYVSAKKSSDIKSLVTRNLYFSFYPKIAENHGLEHTFRSPEFDGIVYSTELGIVDSPSNPQGILTGDKGREHNIVWDAAYHTPTYCGIWKDNKLVCPNIRPRHEAMVGSLNKLTGVNGLRIGWLATDNYNLYRAAFFYVEADLCGVSAPSQDYAVNILKTMDLQAFYVESKALLDNNRTELDRLSYLFGGQPIFPYGMFALFEVDSGIRSLFRKAGVHVMDGKSVGDVERDSIRINLANSNNDTKRMVDDVIKADKS